MAKKKEVDFVLIEVKQGGDDPLLTALDDMKVTINTLIASKKTQLISVNVVQFNDGLGGKDFLLATMVLEKKKK